MKISSSWTVAISILTLTILLPGLALAQAPPNDECSTALVIDSLPYADAQNTRLASANPTDPPLPCADGGGGKTVWYAYTPATTQLVKFSTEGSAPEDYDIAMGLFTGTCGSLTLYKCNDDIIGGTIRQSEIIAEVQGGVTYYVHIAEWDGGSPDGGGPPTGGDLLFTASETLPPPIADGPSSGTVPGGVTVSTDDFTTFAQPGNDLPHRWRRHKENPALIPLTKGGLPPSGPEGSNYVQDRTMQPRSAQDSRPLIMQDFAGIGDIGAFIPPDPDVAVGPNHLMGVVNISFRIWDRDGNVLKTIDGWDWFATTAPMVNPQNPPFDPQIIYDHFAERWIMTWDHQPDTLSHVLISVSDDSDPMGTWYNWSLPARMVGDSLTPTWADYPQLGFDSEALYVTSNNFLFASGFSHTLVRIVPTAQLYQNTAGAITYTDFWSLRDPDNLGTLIFAIQPAQQFDTPGKQYLLSLSRFTPQTYYTLWTISNPLTSPTITATNIPVVQYSRPPDADQLGGSTTLIEPGGDRFENQPIYRDSSLWSVHSIASGPGNAYSAVRYVRLNPHTETVLEDAAMGLDGFWHMWPALMVDANKNVVVTYSRSGLTEFAGAFVSGRKEGDPPGLSPSLALKPGEANYVKTFASGRNRWGDYMGIAMDPTDSTAIWVHTEYAASPANTWGNWVGKIKMGPLPGAFIQTSPASLAFQKTEVGASHDTLSLGITNSGIDTLFVSSIATSGLNFTIVEAPATPLALASLQSDTIRVAFAPVTAGQLEDSVVISSNDALNPNLSVRLLGKGLLIAPAVAGTMYSTSGGTAPGLFTIDEETGGASTVSPTPAGEFRSLTIRPTTNELYGTQASADSTVLYRISSTDGESVPMATIPVGNMQAIAFNESDLLYGATTGGQLYSVVPETGAATLIGTASGIFYSSLVFNPTSGELWASIAPTLALVRDAIFKVNTSDGDTSLVGRTGLSLNTPHLAFDAAGKLYAIIGTGSVESQLYQLDTLTAQASLIGPAGVSRLNAIALRADTLVVSVTADLGSGIPGTYDLFQNYPNPFNPTTQIQYALPHASVVRLSIYNALGQEVVRLVDETRSAGYHATVWNGRSGSGAPVASGMYLYRIEAVPIAAGTEGGPTEPFITSRKMILLK
ncbi:MAG: FlgD immunoglobulin-like domain containing protein [Bacteroidota bacterium]